MFDCGDVLNAVPNQHDPPKKKNNTMAIKQMKKERVLG
jgi:hypothetical protein